MQEINYDTINELIKHVGEDAYMALVKEFIEETSKQLQLINDESFLDNKEAVIRAVHSIKGNSISLGFDRLSQESAILEVELKSTDNNKNSFIFAPYNTYVQTFLMTFLKDFQLKTDVEFKKVLVAEDSSVIQNLLKKILLFENCKITSAKDGQCVLDLFEKEDFDLVIMDINLPKVNGLEAAKSIRSKSNIPIIGISGNARNLPEEDFFNAGMNEYMQKPLDYDKLIELVKKYTA